MISNFVCQWLFFLFRIFLYPRLRNRRNWPIPWAALGAAATVRQFEPFLIKVRPFFLARLGQSTSEQITATRGDSSADMPPPGGSPPTVLPPTMTNADQPEHELNESKLNGNKGIVFQAKPANPGWFGSPGRRWRPVGYTGNHQHYQLKQDNQTNQLTANHTNNRQLTAKQTISLTNHKTT